MRRSVLGGSAIGTLLSLRSGVMDRQLAQAMPFGSLQEAFDLVEDKAEHGEPFCQMLIGNVYFWGDFVTVQGRSREDFDSEDAIQSFLRENYAKCEDWLWRAYRNGVSLACLNLSNFYQNGKQGLISPRPEQEREVDRYGAEKGYPDCLCFYADDIYGENRAEAFELYRRSAKLGEPRAFFWAGLSYELGEGVEKDVRQAAEYYQRTLPLRSTPVEMARPTGWGPFTSTARGWSRTTPRPFSCSSGLTTRATPTTGGPTIWGPATPTAAGPQQDYAAARKFWRWWTGTTEAPFTFWATSMPGDWAARRTSRRGWNTSRRPATMRRPRRSCGTTKRPSSASGCGGKTACKAKRRRPKPKIKSRCFLFWRGRLKSIF